MDIIPKELLLGSSKYMPKDDGELIVVESINVSN